MQKKKKKKKQKKKEKKKTEYLGLKWHKLKMVEQCYYQNVWYLTKKKKSRFMEELEAKGILSSLGLETPLGKIQLLGDILF